MDTHKEFDEQDAQAELNDFSFGRNGLDLEIAAELDAKVERAIALLERTETDITKEYRQWQGIGLAFSYEYLEAGRAYFHRVCRFYPKYSPEECDQKYDLCLERARGSYDLFDFLHMVKTAGFSELDLCSPEEREELEAEQKEWEAYNSRPEKLAKQQQSEQEFLEVLKEVLQETHSGIERPGGFREEVYEELPDFLKRVLKPARGEHETSVLLLGAMGVLSSALPGFYGIYDSLTRPNLYLFVSAPPASGKGILNLSKYLVMPIERAKAAMGKAAREEFDQAMIDFALSKDQAKEKPRKPAEKMHFIPANNSSTGMFQLLNDNQGAGLIFENEADTLLNSLKSDWGDFSDGLRKAFQHEEISYYRRTDRELVRIERPSLSAVLSGTPGQLLKMFPDAENGLFSRFLFYSFSERPKWKDKFTEDNSFDLRNYYESLGNELFRFYQKMENREVQMIYTEEQKEFFNRFFSDKIDDYHAVLPSAFLASVKRLGLSFFRLTMILTALRCMEDGYTPPQRECDFWDFRTAQMMIITLLKHSSSVFSMLPVEKAVSPQPNLKERFFQELGEQFTRKSFLELCKPLGISKRSADRYVAEFVAKGSVRRDLQGVFFKLRSMN